MKRFIIFLLCQLLVFAFPLSNALAEESQPAASQNLRAGFFAGKYAGRLAAAKYRGDSWILGGFAGGFVAGPVGMGVAMGVSQIGTPQPPIAERAAIADSSAEFVRGYIAGYASRVEKRDLGAAFLGGMLGTVLLTAILVAAFSQNIDPM